ncbi:DPBB_1 domain-containing protein [Rhizoctonia solani]|uniref:Non-catalytic module family expn protein n=1 Tax=Rhizoctonia solani TaxID=456999 RepID=A0A8H7LHB4_9AGAM|nr:Non-catalytic module family expn protein [Rhizoctonia solani]KAF8673974.1 Non-catalytic module family expn protein [Rhizoctonia solani]
MFVFVKLAAIVSLASCVLAAPVEAPAGTGTNELAVRAPYDVHNGWATYYNPSVGTGACGWNNGDYEWVAAVGTSLFQEMMFDGNPNHSQACGKTANVSWNGKTIKVGIVDRCYACGYNDIDLSSSAFQQFAGLGTGKLQGVSWRFN